MSEEHLKAAQRLVSMSGADLAAVTSDINIPQLGMESPAEARTFSQVVFIDISHSYPPSTPINCCYTLNAAFTPNPRDWVGIFKVGWSSTKEYHTFVWVEPCLDRAGEHSETRQAVFKDYYLPKDEAEFYQFCYIDSSGQVRGASTPFCFRNPAELSSDCSPDDDLLVITTQEQVEQSLREKAELQKDLHQMMEENETLKSALQKEQEEAASLKEQNEQKEKENCRLRKDLRQVKDENESLNSTLQQELKQKDQLKEEMLTQMTKELEIQQHNTAEQKQIQEKYDRAVMKIKQLKEEHEELRGRVAAQEEETAVLNSKLRERERELFRLKDNNQLLQVDLQSSEKEKERLSAELQRLQILARSMDDVQRENQELYRRLQQQETLQSCPDDLRAQCQTLVGQLQDAEAKLVAEKEESRNSKRRAEFLEKDLQQLEKQLEDVVSACDEAQKKGGKLELHLAEAHEVIADKSSLIEEKEHMIALLEHEKEELARENQNLTSDIAGLQSLYAELQEVPPADPPHMQPDFSSAAHERQQPQIPEQAENLYETIESLADPDEEQSLVCSHCQESFPCITRHELEQHEQSHRVCPFCTMLCDNMEQSVFEDHVYSHEL